MIDKANYAELRRIRATTGYSFRIGVRVLDEGYISAKKFLSDVRGLAEDLDTSGIGEEILAIAGFYQGWNIRLRVSRDYFTITVSTGTDRRVLQRWQFLSQFDGVSMDDFEYYVIQEIRKMQKQLKTPARNEHLAS